jgi:hypothetical protein
VARAPWAGFGDASCGLLALAAGRVGPEKGIHTPQRHILSLALAVSLNLCMTSRAKMTILHLLNYTGSLLAFNPRRSLFRRSVSRVSDSPCAQPEFSSASLSCS